MADEERLEEVQRWTAKRRVALRGQSVAYAAASAANICLSAGFALYE